MKLISVKNIKEFYTEGQKELCIDPKQVITPAAKDWLKNKGVEIIYSDQKTSFKKSINNPVVSTPQQSAHSKSDLAERIIFSLVNNYDIKKSDQLVTIVSKTIAKLSASKGR